MTATDSMERSTCIKRVKLYGHHYREEKDTKNHDWT